MIFFKVKPDVTTLWKLMSFWKRFIDDIFGVWTGTIRQFNLFISKLNDLTRSFGIQFGDSQIGKTVNFLDVTLILSDNNRDNIAIEYKLYKKDTDARMTSKLTAFIPNMCSSQLFSHR